MLLKHLEVLNFKKWNEYVELHNKGSFFHYAEWMKVIQESFSHKPIYLFAEQDDKILGILPLVEINSLIFGHTIISIPYCVYGGILADNEDVESFLFDEAVKIATSLNVDYLEFRNISDSLHNLPATDLYVTFRKPISSNHGENLNSIPRKQRAVIRKGIALGLVSEVDTNINRFYSLYSESLRNLGTPTLSKRYFLNLLDTFGEKCEIRTVLHNGIPVSSVLSFFYKNEVLPYYGGGNETARHVFANDFMYWEVMQNSANRGVNVFDFGRSKLGTGSYRFKTHWGFVPTPLNYQYYLVNSKEIPTKNPLNPKYSFAIKVWKKLPLSVANFVGPFIAPYYG